MEKYEIKQDSKGRFVVICFIQTLMDNTFEGRATCNPEDEFDPTIGMNLAFVRAKLKQANLIEANRFKVFEEAEHALNKLRNKAYKACRATYHLEQRERNLMRDTKVRA